MLFKIAIRKMSRLCLDKGGDPKQGLFIAIQEDNPQAALLCLDKGADPHEGLIIAIQQNSPDEIFELFLTARIPDMVSVIYIAVTQDRFRQANYLFEHNKLDPSVVENANSSFELLMGRCPRKALSHLHMVSRMNHPKELDARIFVQNLGLALGLQGRIDDVFPTSSISLEGQFPLMSLNFLTSCIKSIFHSKDAIAPDTICPSQNRTTNGFLTKEEWRSLIDTLEHALPDQGFVGAEMTAAHIASRLREGKPLFVLGGSSGHCVGLLFFQMLCMCVIGGWGVIDVLV